MADQPKIEAESLRNLFLDAANPRLGRHNVDRQPTQDEVLDLMKDWTLEELAVSFLENGFWPQEALIAVMEQVVKSKTHGLVVVEGNRRLAALKMIERTRSGLEKSSKWTDLIAPFKPEAFKRLESIPYILMPSRKSVQSYLGFRHVTGINPWNPTEKAQFIAHLIEDEKLTYEQVRRRIGSKLPAVRQNYISYRLLLQMEDNGDQVAVDKVEERFSVLYLSLRTEGVQKYLHIDIAADPKDARRPVPTARLKELANFAKWLFGDQKNESIISDSRQVDDFGRALLSKNAREYLERTPRPVFEVARRMAGVDEEEISTHIERAADEIEEALKAVHRLKGSPRLQVAVKRLGQDAMQLLDIFPAIKAEVMEEAK
jgi:hypothetical protein